MDKYSFDHDRVHRPRPYYPTHSKSTVKLSPNRTVLNVLLFRPHALSHDGLSSRTPTKLEWLTWARRSIALVLNTQQ